MERYLELKLNRTGKKVQQRTSFSTDDSATAVPTTEMVSSPPELLRFISARMCQSLLIADISVKQFIELDQWTFLILLFIDLSGHTEICF